MVVLVGRSHRCGGTLPFVNPRWSSYTSPTVNTAANSSIGYLRATSTTNSAPFLQGGNPAGSSNATDCYKAIPGAQLQVMAIRSQATAGGGTRLYINNDVCAIAQQTTAVSNYLGAVIGGNPGSSNSEGVGTSSQAVFDLYELAIWNTGPADAAADAIVAAAVTNYAIAQLDTNLVLEGDSITQGIATTLSESPANCKGLGSRLTDPGSSRLPGNVRVLNCGTSGDTVANLVTARDATNSVYDKGKYPGGAVKNVIALQIGRNDLAATAGTAASVYASIVALLNTTTTGYLQRGWSVVEMGNIGSNNTSITGSPSDGPITLQQRIAALRALMFGGSGINTTFQSDVLAGSGQAYDGLVTVKPLHLITVAGDSKFDTATDAGDTASGYYDSDGTHLRVAGIDLMIGGGEQPGYGYGSVL